MVELITDVLNYSTQVQRILNRHLLNIFYDMHSIRSRYKFDAYIVCIEFIKRSYKDRMQLPQPYLCKLLRYLSEPILIIVSPSVCVCEIAERRIKKWFMV